MRKVLIATALVVASFGCAKAQSAVKTNQNLVAGGTIVIEAHYYKITIVRDEVRKVTCYVASHVQSKGSPSISCVKD